LHSALRRLREKSREVVVSVVGMVKVAASCLPPAELEPLLPAIVRGLLVWSGERKERIRARVRSLLERLVRRFGFDALRPLLPAADAPLIEHMQKAALRRDRRRAQQVAAAAAAAGLGGGAAAPAASAVHTSFSRLVGDDEDFDDDDEGGDALLDDFDGGGGDGGSVAAARSLAGRGAAVSTAGGASVVRSIAASWGVVGARPVLPQGMLGGTSGGVGRRGTHLAEVTLAMRAGSAALSSAPLPPAGAITEGQLEFAGRGRAMAMRAASAAVSAITGGGASAVLSLVSAGASRMMLQQARGAAAASVAASSASTSKRAARRAAAEAGGDGRGSSAALLRADDDAPIDLLDTAASSRTMIGADPLSLAAWRRRRDAEAARHTAAGGATVPATGVGDVLPPGMRIGADGRLVIDADDEDDGGKDGGKEAGSGAAGGSHARRRRGGAAVGEDDDEDDTGGGGGGGVDDDGDGDDDDDDIAAAKAGRTKRQQKERRVRWKEDDVDGDRALPARGGGGPQGWGQRKAAGGAGARAGGKAPGVRHSGAEFKAGSGGGGARGDVKRSGAKFEPFAYVPFGSRGAGSEGAAGRFDGVVASTSRAARVERKRGAASADNVDLRQLSGHKRRR